MRRESKRNASSTTSFLLTPRASRLLRSARVAHLATADASGRPHVVPICFAVAGRELFTPIDAKPKRAAPLRLKRVRNIAANPHVAVVVDRYDEDWRRLEYVLLSGRARLVTRGKLHRQAIGLLRRKYSQYRNMLLENNPLIWIHCKTAIVWSAGSA